MCVCVCICVCVRACVCVCVVWSNRQVWCVSGVTRGGCSREKPVGVRAEPARPKILSLISPWHKHPIFLSLPPPLSISFSLTHTHTRYHTQHRDLSAHQSLFNASPCTEQFNSGQTHTHALTDRTNKLGHIQRSSLETEVGFGQDLSSVCSCCHGYVPG